MDGTVHEATAIGRARIAVSVGFFIFGLVWAIWAVHIPAISAALSLDPALLGLALLNVGLGAVISQLITGWLISRIGSRLATRIFLPLFLASPLLPIVAWTVPLLFAGTFVFGLVSGGANVAINTQGSQIETAYRKPIMSSFHGFFSLGALAGSLAGAGIIALNRQDGTGAAAVIAVMVLVALATGQFYLEVPPASVNATRQARRGFSLPTAAVLYVAVICFFANSIEGAVGDWSALYLTTIRDLTPAVAASGYAIYSLTMAICRLGGGPVVVRLGEKRVVLYGGALVALGMAVVVFTPWAAVSPFGFGLVAVGAANTLPVLISIGGRAPGTTAGAGVAATATGALLGLLVGPPVIGFVAHAMGLPAALAMLSLVGLIVALGAALYRWPAPLTAKA